MSHLVIPLADKREKKRAELFQDGAKRVQDQQQKPLLQQNVVPGLDTLQDVADKYRHDVALRPDALDVLSDVYESVPVEAFGAALLRGMGWKGDETMDDKKQEALQPRHKLLGLGATKRPTLAGESQRKKTKKKKVKRKTEDGDGRSEIEDEDQRSAGTRLMDRERRCSRGRLDRRKRSRSESRERLELAL
uniref:Spp2/MOS2 G-patch domain-containing protein n=1 Tax=Hyaloperonospora arabidopsidis (strain Emoy2) TaxID=559515 RepID=M4B7A9_HYAAE